MATNELNLGSDTTIVVVGPYGTIDFGIVTKFDFKQDQVELVSNGLDKVSRFAYVPMGWTGSIENDRANATVDDFIARLEADYYNGEVEHTWTIYDYTVNADGSYSSYQFTGVVLSLDDGGPREKDKLIRQRVKFRASKREKI